MLVIIAGMPRSASTFSFNIAREILSAHRPVTCEVTNGIGPYLFKCLRQHVIIKTHAPDSSLQKLISLGLARTLCTYRKPEDAVASRHHTFGQELEQSLRLVGNWLDWHSGTRNTLDIDYRDIEGDSQSVIHRIQSHLVGHENEEQAERLATAYSREAVRRQYESLDPEEDVTDVGFSYYDNKTLFHRNHIKAEKPCSAAETLTAQQLANVRAAFCRYTDEQQDYIGRPG